MLLWTINASVSLFTNALTQIEYLTEHESFVQEWGYTDLLPCLSFLVQWDISKSLWSNSVETYNKLK